MEKWNADAIKALREKLNLSQTQLSQRLNIRQQTVSEWEVGMYTPRGGSIVLLDLLEAGKL